MEFRSTLFLFIGYNPFHHGYRFLDQSTNHLYIVHHVGYDESSFPFSTTNPHPHRQFLSKNQHLHHHQLHIHHPRSHLYHLVLFHLIFTKTQNNNFHFSLVLTTRPSASPSPYLFLLPINLLNYANSWKTNTLLYRK